MSVIPLTVFFSLLLAGLFMVLFAHEQRRRRFASAERDSLLPLADERGVAEGRERARADSEQARASTPAHPDPALRPPSADAGLYF